METNGEWLVATIQSKRLMQPSSLNSFVISCISDRNDGLNSHMHMRTHGSRPFPPDTFTESSTSVSSWKSFCCLDADMGVHPPKDQDVDSPCSV